MNDNAEGLRIGPAVDETKLIKTSCGTLPPGVIAGRPVGDEVER